MHLSDEQLDEWLDGTGDLDEHLRSCDSCRSRLEQRRAIRARLRAAFASVQPAGDLGDRIRSLCAGPRQTGDRQAQGQRSGRRARRRRVLFLPPVSLLATAAGLLVAVIAGFFIGRPAPAQGDSTQLLRIHEANLRPASLTGQDVRRTDDPRALAAFLRQRLGFVPAFPPLRNGHTIRVCRVVRFHREMVGSYLVQTPHARISVIVMSDKPQDLGLGRRMPRDGHVFYASPVARNNLIAVRLDHRTYCAVGQTMPEHLAELLDSLVQAQRNHPPDNGK